MISNDPQLVGQKSTGVIHSEEKEINSLVDTALVKDIIDVGWKQRMVLVLSNIEKRCIVTSFVLWLEGTMEMLEITSSASLKNISLQLIIWNPNSNARIFWTGFHFNLKHNWNSTDELNNYCDHLADSGYPELGK